MYSFPPNSLFPSSFSELTWPATDCTRPQTHGHVNCQTWRLPAEQHILLHLNSSADDCEIFKAAQSFRDARKPCQVRLLKGEAGRWLPFYAAEDQIIRLKSAKCLEIAVICKMKQVNEHEGGG